MPFAPDTTMIFQVIGLTLFGVLKSRPRYELPFEEKSCDDQIHIDGISQLQTNDGPVKHMGNLSGTWI
jgi:hypothetical protein